MNIPDMVAFIKQYQRENGMAPTRREIADGCGVSSTSVVAYWLKKAEQKGYLTVLPNRARAIKLERKKG